MKFKHLLLTTVLITASAFTIPVFGGNQDAKAVNPVPYINHTKSTEISEITTILIHPEFPKEIIDMWNVSETNQNGDIYFAWYDINGQKGYTGTYSLHYINLIDVANLYKDGTHKILPDGRHEFIFGGNTVIIAENSNSISINGKESFMGKIRYSESKDDKTRFGFWFGNKAFYDKSIKNFGTWVPAEALDEVLDFGLRGQGGRDIGSFVTQAKFGIAVPEQYKVITPYLGLQPYKKENVADVRYTQMKNQLPTEIKNKIKESTTTNLLFGEDYSNIDNYDQIAKMVKAIFSGIEPISEEMIYYHKMSESELADEFRRIAKEGKTQYIDFHEGYYRDIQYSNNNFGVQYKLCDGSRIVVRVYFSGPEKKNGISFAIYLAGNGQETGDYMFHILKSIYPYEMAEHIIKDSLTGININDKLSAPGNNRFSQHNIVKAYGKYKWFTGRLPSDMREFNPRVTYFLLDNHPAMVEEQFCSSSYIVWELTDLGLGVCTPQCLKTHPDPRNITPTGGYYEPECLKADNPSKREFRETEGYYGRGYREDFFTFSEIPSEVKAKIGMKEIYDNVNYELIETSQIAHERLGTTKQPLEKCSNNPYGTYGKLK